LDSPKKTQSRLGLRRRREGQARVSEHLEVVWSSQDQNTGRRPQEHGRVPGRAFTAEALHMCPAQALKHGRDHFKTRPCPHQNTP
ncbi:unnamed protein product, partial [Linum tenue]